MAVRKKKLTPRVKNGVAGIPLDNWEKAKYYVHYELDKKPTMEIVKSWIKENFSKSDSRAILANPDYLFHMYSHYATGIVWLNNGLEFPDNWKQLTTRIKEFYSEYIEKGKKILVEKEKEAQAKSNVRVLTPQQRMWNKVNDTIIEELDTMEDEWMDGQTTEIDLYNRMRFHDIKGPALEMVKSLRLDGWYSDYYDAYHKKCDQAVEGYSHLSRKEIKRRLNVVTKMIEDVEKLKASNKAVRTRVKKPKAADAQVKNVKYLKEEVKDYKLASINPVLIVGAMRLFTFNVKTRMLTEYVSNAVKGFEVKGTTIQHIDEETSRCTRLRKPDDILPSIMSKTPKQIDNIFKGLSTKINVPNGRINGDTIILRALDK